MGTGKGRIGKNSTFRPLLEIGAGGGMVLLGEPAFWVVVWGGRIDRYRVHVVSLFERQAHHFNGKAVETALRLPASQVIRLTPPDSNREWVRWSLPGWKSGGCKPGRYMVLVDTWSSRVPVQRCTCRFCRYSGHQDKRSCRRWWLPGCGDRYRVLVGRSKEVGRL